MFFVLSKVLGFFSLPSNFIAVVCVIGAAAWLLKRRRAGAHLLLLGTVLLLLFGYSPLGNGSGLSPLSLRAIRVNPVTP